MANEPKRQEALRLLKATGMRQSTYAPPLLRLLWSLGFDVPPPHFASVIGNALVAGTFFTFSWGLTMWFLLWRMDDMPLLIVLGTSVATGTIFGIAMAAYYARGKRKYGLPNWNAVASADTSV